MRLILALLVALVVALPAQAQTACRRYTPQSPLAFDPSDGAAGPHYSASSACGAVRRSIMRWRQSLGISVGSSCAPIETSPGQGNCRCDFTDFTPSGPDRHDVDWGQFISIEVSAEECSGAPEEEEECSAGRESEQNFTIGWSRLGAGDPHYASDVSAWDVAVAVAQSLPGTSACNGKCAVNVGAPKQVWQAYTPASNGLYRLSADYGVTETGESCSTKHSSLDSNAAPAACDGAQGTINGKPVCVKQGGGSDPNYTSPTAEPIKIGNPTAGSDGDKPITDPTRTPTGGGGGGGGGGGSGGGPTSPRDGEIRGGGSDGAPGGGGGGGGTEIELNTCGLPGKPPCKIDETGTPGDGADRFGDAQEQADEGKESALEALENIKSQTQAPGWTWTFALPSGCSQISLPAFAPWISSIDVCQWQPMIHDLMSILWIAGAIFACWSLVTNTLTRT